MKFHGGFSKWSAGLAFGGLLMVGSFAFGQSPLLVPEAFGEDVAPSINVESYKMERVSAALPINALYAKQWVRTTEDGTLRGSVIAFVGEDMASVSGVRVTLSQQGKRVLSAVSGSDGSFTMNRITPGYYSVVTESQNSFATHGLVVLDNSRGKHLPSTAEIYVVRPISERLREILSTQTVPSSISDTMAAPNLEDPLGDQRMFATSHRISVARDGVMIGTMTQMGVPPEMADMSGMTAFLFKDGREVARSVVSRSGDFRFNNIAPGSYGLIAAGNKGIAAVGFVATLANSITENRNSDGSVFVAAQGGGGQLNVELADTADVMSVADVGEADDPADDLAVVPPPSPFGPGMMGGGGSFGGGGGGQFGGNLLGGIAGIGALAGIAAIVASNNNDTIVNPPVIISPIVVQQ